MATVSEPSAHAPGPDLCRLPVPRACRDKGRISICVFQPLSRIAVDSACKLHPLPLKYSRAQRYFKVPATIFSGSSQDPPQMPPRCSQDPCVWLQWLKFFVACGGLLVFSIFPLRMEKNGQKSAFRRAGGGDFLVFKCKKASKKLSPGE